MESHRLFVGFPLEQEVASEMHAWAQEKYKSFNVKLVPAHHLHVTLLFFPSVSDEKKEWMADLIRQVDLHSVDSLTSHTVKLGMGALALELKIPQPNREELEAHLLRGAAAEPDAPLSYLAREQGGVIHKTLRLHVTFGRCRKQDAKFVPLFPAPKLQVHIGRIALYESHLGKDEARYEIVALKTL